MKNCPYKFHVDNDKPQPELNYEERFKSNGKPGVPALLSANGERRSRRAGSAPSICTTESHSRFGKGNERSKRFEWLETRFGPENPGRHCRLWSVPIWSGFWVSRPPECRSCGRERFVPGSLYEPGHGLSLFKK